MAGYLDNSATTKPVSYTHLDVYKRQDNDLFLIIMLSFSFIIAGIGVICFIKTGIIWASYEKLLHEGEYSKENKEKPSIAVAVYTACLLYTSSCFYLRLIGLGYLVYLYL